MFWKWDLGKNCKRDVPKKDKTSKRPIGGEWNGIHLQKRKQDRIFVLHLSSQALRYPTMLSHNHRSIGGNTM
jgi:hypothetical protein